MCIGNVDDHIGDNSYDITIIIDLQYENIFDWNIPPGVNKPAELRGGKLTDTIKIPHWAALVTKF